MTIAVIAVLLVWWVSSQVSYTDLDWLSYDFTVLHGGLTEPSKEIVSVDIDEETFDRVGKYPFPRSTVAEIVNKVGKARPKAIGLDVLLSEPRSEAEDKQLQDALTSAASVVLVSLAPIGNLRPLMPQPIFCQPDNAQEITGFCKDGTPGAFGYAFVNLPFDADGFIREAIVLRTDRDSGAQGSAPFTVSFPVTMAQNFTGDAMSLKKDSASFGGKKVHYWDADAGTFLIGSWGREPATTIPAWKLLEGRVPDSALAGKLVLIGQSNSAANDRQFTPLFRSPSANGERLRLPGTQILAAAIRSLLEGTTVRRTPTPLVWGVAGLLCCAASFLLLRLSNGVGLICTFLLGILGAVASLLLYSRTRTWLPFLPQELGLVLTVPLTLGVQFVSERIVAREASAQRKEMMGLFASYVDPAVADTIWERRSEVSLAGEKRIATVMFTDIRSFTALSYGQPPAEVLKWLNEYMSAMDEVIREYGGFLNKFIGDGLMIIFGLPLSKGVSDDAQRAMRAAQAMLQRVEALNANAAGDSTRPRLRIGIGVHSGELMAGSIGSATRQEYSVIGETVNLASRLESQNKAFKTEILFSEATRTFLGSNFPGIVSLGEAMVPGLVSPVPVYTLAPAHGSGADLDKEKTT